MDILLFTTRLSIIACRHLVPFFYKNEYVRASDIAKLYQFNTRSISSAFTILTKAGILNSQVGGNNRGFILARDPKKISLYDIVKVLEQNETVECCGDVINCKPGTCSSCSIYKELNSVIDNKRKILSATSIYSHYENLLKQEELCEPV